MNAKLSQIISATCLGICLCLILSACSNGGGGGGEKKDAVVPLSPSTLAFPRQYFFNDLNARCETPNFQVASLQEFCNRLQDEVFNRNCASVVRKQQYAQYCSTTLPAPVNPGGDTAVDERGESVNMLSIRCVTWVVRDHRKGIFNWRTGNGGEMVVIPWDLRSTSQKPVSNSYGRITARIQPSRLGAPATLEIAVQRSSESFEYSAKGFVGREVTLQVEDRESNRTVRVTCEPVRKMAPPKRNFLSMNCAGKVGNSSSTLFDFNKNISVDDLSSSVSLLERSNSRVESIELNAYAGNNSSEESSTLELANASGRDLMARSSIKAPLELKVIDRRNASRIEVKCVPSME